MSSSPRTAAIVVFALFGISVVSASADPVISEFMADNDTTIADEDGDFPDWIEILNPADGEPVDLLGWYLTDKADNLTKWAFPSVELNPGARVLVFASEKDRATEGSELHTNFQLDVDGEFLALVRPDGVTVASGLFPFFPPQFDDVAFGLGIAGTVTETDATPTWSHPSNYTGVRIRSSGPGVAQLSSSLDSFDRGTGDDRTQIYVWLDLSDALPSVPSGDTLLSAQLSWSGNARDSISISGVPTPTVESKLGLFTVPDADRGVDTISSPFATDAIVSYYAANTPMRESTITPGADASISWDITEQIQTWLDNPGTPQRGEFMILHDSRPIHFDWDSISSNLSVSITTTDAPSLDPVYGYLAAPTPGDANLGSMPTGPLISEFTDDPAQPAPGSDLPVTARIDAFLNPIDSVRVFYRMAYENETELEMRDDGTAGDATAGDGIYTALIPGSEVQAGQMTRWRFEAEDTAGFIAKEPPYRVPANPTLKDYPPEYHGTVAIDPSIETNLTVLHWFVPANYIGAVDTTSGGRSSVYYKGEFYDNVYFNRHGQSSGGFPKKSYNIDFNGDDRFRWDDDAPRVRDIDLLTNWADKSKVRHVLAWEIMRLSGVKGHFAYTVRVQRNGDFFSTADFVEDADDIYLERAGLNKNGSLYKVYDNRLNKDLGDSIGGVEKKTRRHESNAEIQEIIDGLDLTGQNLKNYLYDNVNIPMCVNMCAANCVIRNTDMHRKNWYLYRDTGKTNEWGILPWDLDLSAGRKWNSTDRYFDNALMTNDVLQVGTAVRLVSHMFSNSNFPEIRQMMYRRIRTLSDEFLAPPYYENRLAELSQLIDPPEITPSDALRDFMEWGSWTQSAGFNGQPASVPYDDPHPDVEDMAEAIGRWHNEYLPGRRNEIFNLEPEIPAAQVGSPLINFGMVEFSPASGIQDEEYIELINPNGAVAVDISNWKLSEAVDFTFEPGTVIPRSGRIYVSPNRNAFRAMATRPNNGNSNYVVGNYGGHLSSFGETIRLLDDQGAEVNSFAYVGQPSLVQQYLVISEIMYHPEPNGGAEFIELLNTHPTETLNLTGVRFTNGVQFDFTNSMVTSLAPGERVLVVRELDAFESVHGAALPVAGEFANLTSLNNDGEEIKLEDADDGTVKEFTYNDQAPWPTAADAGFSLVLIDAMSNPDPSVPENWRASVVFGGNPNADDTETFAGDPNADSDGNGQSDLLDHAMFSQGTADRMMPAASLVTLTVGENTDDYAVVAFRENVAADDASLSVEVSYDLFTWSGDGGELTFLDAVYQNDGTNLVRYRSSLPATGDFYIRIIATLAE